MHTCFQRWLALAATAAIPTSAQLIYKNCPDLAASDFQMSELVNRKGTSGAVADSGLSEPTRMDVRVVNGPNGKYDHSDIIFVERLGKVKWYDGVTKKVHLMGTINVWGQSDNGLMGVALDPDFEKSRLAYFWYSPKQLIGLNRQLRLTRMVVKPDNTLDMASEKILINILGSKTDTWHSGGPMQFDAYGDLWVAVGNNSSDVNPTECSLGNNVLSKTDSTASAEWGPSNTASLRGGFFRIHPDSSAKGYSIPRGNFGEYWADQFDKQGKADLAKQYRDPAKVLPEVYVKGERSNFSIAVHPTKRWLAWGTVNYASVNDEFNITDHPIFSGFPYFHNNNLPVCNNGKDPNDPVNDSPLNSGVAHLPPAIPGTFNNLVNVSIGGPIYHFDPGLDYDNKFPPHFDNKWILASFRGGMWAVTLDTNTVKPIGAPLKLDNGLFGSFSVRNYVQSMYGKDGALYILNYDGYYNSAINPGIMRVIYKGACHVPVSVDRKPQPYQRIWLSRQGLEVAEPGSHAFALYDLAGHRLWSAEGVQGAVYRFSDLRSRAGLKAGLYEARVTTSSGSFTRLVSLF